MRKLILTLTAVLVVAGLASQAASAQACTQWDLSYIQLKQSNGYIVGLGAQSGTQFNGRVSLSRYGNGWVQPFSGGFMQGWTYQSRFTATIYWDFGASGSYEGTIDYWGHVHGTTYDRRNTASWASFDSTRNARCVS